MLMLIELFQATEPEFVKILTKMSINMEHETMGYRLKMFKLPPNLQERRCQEV